MNAVFYNNTLKKHIGFGELADELISYIKEKENAEYKITVGTDSPGTNKTFFVTAITVLRAGNGGRYFWTKTGEIYCPTLYDRIYKEVMQSVTLTQELKSRLKDRLGEEFFWDDKIAIHIDAGRNGSTKDFVDGVLGMVKGYGFEAEIKPKSFCASVVADKHT
jgi:hypothetical protein